MLASIARRTVSFQSTMGTCSTLQCGATQHSPSHSICLQHARTLWAETLLLGAGPHRGTLGPSPPPSGRGPIERTRADTPHLRRHLREAHAASPRGVAHGRGPRLAPGLTEPGDKTGPRLSPHLAPSTTGWVTVFEQCRDRDRNPRPAWAQWRVGNVAKHAHEREEGRHQPHRRHRQMN